MSSGEGMSSEVPGPSDFSGRVLRVFVEGWIIEDGSLTRPEVGRTATVRLEFRQHRLDNPTDPRITRVRGVVQPERLLTGDAGAPRWDSVLRGDGWSAFWRSDRPRTGQVEVTGLFGVDFQFGADDVRGLVTRVQVVTAGYVFETDPPRWRPAPGVPARLADVSSAPCRFEQPDGGHPEPGRRYDREMGVLVDLDLDRAEPAPLRPSIIPGSIGAHGNDLWVLDRELPILVHIADPAGHPVATEHLLPAPVATAPVLRGFRQVFVDADGCWVVGTSSVTRVTVGPDGAVLAAPVDVGTVWGSAAVGGVLLTLAEHDAHLHIPGGAPIQLCLPEGKPGRPVATDEGFLLLIEVDRIERSAPYGGVGYVDRLLPVRITQDGQVTAAATPVELDAGARLIEVPGGARFDAQGRSVIIDTSLRLRTANPLPGRTLSGGRAGRLMWLTTHRPDGTGGHGWWPLQRELDVPPREAGRWLFVLRNPESSQVEAVMPIGDPQPDVAATDDGTVWIAGAGLRGLRPGGTVVDVDVPALLG